MSELGKQAEQSSVSEWPMFGQANLEVAQQFWKRSETFAKVLLDWNTEITHFVSQRVNRSSEDLGRVTQCRSVPEVVEVEAQWLRGIFDDYFAEARRLMEFNSRIIGSFVEPTGPVETHSSATRVPKREQAEAAD
jgi:hypothetical protein